jgi:hypothetical protein
MRHYTAQAALSPALRLRYAAALRHLPETVATLAEQQRIRWDTSALTTAYCNLANARDKDGKIEISVGVSRPREQVGAELEIELLHRVVLDPGAAARLQELLIKLLADYNSASSSDRTL